MVKSEIEILQKRIDQKIKHERYLIKHITNITKDLNIKNKENFNVIPCLKEYDQQGNYFWMCSSMPMNTEKAKTWLRREWSDTDNTWSREPDVIMVKSRGWIDNIFMHPELPNDNIVFSQSLFDH